MGWFLGGNIGLGTADINVTGESTDRESGGAGNFRVGYAFQPAWTVGGEASVWTKKVDDVTWTFSVVSGSVTWFPNAEGFFVRGGIGVGKVEAQVSGSGF